MVISLGRLSLKSEPTSDRMNVAGMHTSGLTSEDIMREMLEQAYDKFTLDIQNIQVCVQLLCIENTHFFFRKIVQKYL